MDEKPMTSDQADEIIDLLRQILSELEDSRSNVADMAFDVGRLRDKIVGD
jgi:hypothetical protein